MLSGRTALVVETEIIIALGIQDVLQTLNAAHVILATGASDALAKAPLWSQAAVAIIEIETSRPDLLKLAQSISQNGIPVLGVSADTRLASGVPELPGTPIIIKPVPDDDLAAALRACLD